MKEMGLALVLVLMGIGIDLTNGNVIQASSVPNEAHVAVLDCSKKYPNVYYDLGKKEWMVHTAVSADSRCYNTESDLLELCKIVYPNLNVVNVMRLDEPVKFTIYGCTAAKNQPTNDETSGGGDKLKNCSKLKIKRVQPYKCLHGEFQSTELYIPPKCRFQHLYSNNGCQTQDYWSQQSAEKCKSNADFVVNSSMLLQWCDAATSGPATFSGIEFVCCPKQAAQQVDQLNYMEDEDIDDENEDDDDDEEEANSVDDSNNTSNEDETNQLLDEGLIDDKKIDDYETLNKIDTKATLPKIPSIIDQNEVKKFEETKEISYSDIKTILDKFDSRVEEHNDLEAVEGTREQKEQYEKQKQFIMTSIQSSMDTLLKEKEKSRVYLTDKKNKVSQKLLDNMNNQFQTRLNRLNDEKNRMLLQEEVSYEQQIQGRLNEKKLNSIRELNRVMQENDLNSKIENVEPVVKSLYEFVIAQESDRLHMITVYKKLRAYFPQQLKERAQSIVNHLESIDRTINETLNMFKNKFNKLSEFIIPALNDHLKRYDQVRNDCKLAIEDLKNVMLNINVNEKGEIVKMVDLKKKVKTVKQIVLQSSTTAKSKSADVDFVNEEPTAVNSKSYNYDDSDSDGDDDDNENNVDDGYDSDDSLGDDIVSNDDDGDSDDEDDDDDDVKNKKSSIVEDAIQGSINIKRLKSSDSNLSQLCIIIGVCLGMFFSIILIFAMIRHKRMQAQHMVKHGFVPVETSNPEDRHVSNMQINGYENPTYKFFENTTIA